MRRLIFFVFIIQLAHCIGCPPGLDLVQEGQCRGNLTRITTDGATSINVAISKCGEIESQPIIIHNQEEQSYWSERVDNNLWTPIGLVCDHNSKKWIWADGSFMDFKPPSDKYDSPLDSDCDHIGQATWVIRHGDGYWSYITSGSRAFDIFCIKQLRALVQSADGCDNFEDDKEDGVCYQVGATVENWQDAQMMCLKLGANLASIHNNQENSFIRRLAVSKGAVNGVYLGATISGKGKEYGWIDGSEWDYSNFHTGFPMSGTGECLAMDTSTSAGLWMNIPCSETLPVACIRDQRTVVEPSCSDGPWEEDTIITSPGFPYKSSLPCEYFLAVEDGMKLELEIILLEANSCCDYLELTDDFLGGHVIANLTGIIGNSTFTTSATNLMRVSWNPNGGVNVMGVAFTYRAV